MGGGGGGAVMEQHFGQLYPMGVGGYGREMSLLSNTGRDGGTGPPRGVRSLFPAGTSGAGATLQDGGLKGLLTISSKALLTREKSGLV